MMLMAGKGHDNDGDIDGLGSHSYFAMSFPQNNSPNISLGDSITISNSGILIKVCFRGNTWEHRPMSLIRLNRGQAILY